MDMNVIQWTINCRVGEEKRLRIGISLKLEACQVPDTAVRAVATDQPARRQCLFESAGISDNCSYSIRGLGEPDEFFFPVHINPETRQVLDKDPLSPTLRQADGKTIETRQTAES